MEFDSQSQCSDEVAELSISEHGELYQGDFSYIDDNESLEAKIVYLLMPKNVPISRAARLQWLLDHLNTTITIPSHKLNEYSNDLQIISAISREQNLSKCNHFLITWRTEVKFVAQNYRFVYCLDMSPSHAIVDIQKGEVLFNEILNCFKCSLQGLSHEFTIPGNSCIFQPCIFLTIMVNTPFFISPAQQVILKGIQMTPDNLSEIIKCVENHFYLLESKIADVAAMALDQIEHQKVIRERTSGDLLESGKTVPVVTPDANFVNMLRYSMLAILLLPETSLSHILVITDGIVAMPDSNIMESLLFQLHYDAIAVSFLKVGSTFHPHSPAGFVSYTDLLYFFAHSTLGTCLENFVHVENDAIMSMNIYHEIFLLWSFHSGNKYANMKICDNSSWTVLNELFYSHRLPTLLSKRQTDENTTASILLLLARRMREGFTVDNIYYMNGNLEIKLILQWKSSIYIHYRVSSEWPIPKNQTHFEVYVSAPYEFLHDMTCWIKKETKSLYRQAIIDRFWLRLSQLSSGDLGLAHQLSSFQFNKDWYLLPESVKNGLSVFNNLNNGTCSDTTKLVLTPRDVSCLKFVNIWQPIAQLETNNWRKWFHTHKISLILKHDDSPDNPVPKQLHIASSSQRYQVIQCRQAVKALYGMLANWASFILIDNHTYLKLLYVEQNKSPLWFCIVRVTLKYLCAVLNIGFSTHTPGYLRHKICDELKIELSSLSYLSSPVKSKDNLCCIVLHKPLEKFLIRYERIPNNYTTVIFPDGTQPPHTTLNLPLPFTGSLFTTLSRYLFHKRWIWSATHYPNLRLPDNAISRILNTLTRMRMREGYTFAHSSSGIITMVLELNMDPQATCVVQYVLFPPHFARYNDDNCSGSDEENEHAYDEAEMQMVTEVWIEPQYGKVVPTNPRIGYMDDKYYYEIADVISKIDMQCINVLLTMEHLSLMCQDRNNIISNHGLLNSSRKNCAHKTCRISESQSVPDSGSPWYPIVTPRIEHIPFKFDPINILPLCSQNELLFSMFIEPKEKSFISESKVDKANRLLLDNILEHLGLLHDHELDLSKDDSYRFTQHILLRHKNTFPHMCPLTTSHSKVHGCNSQWRCFVKGVSITHVILTFIPATLDDLKALVVSDIANIPSSNESTDSVDRASSRGSNFSDVPLNTSNAICLPVYVFDCPLATLVNSYVNYLQEVPMYTDDVYEDHRFTTFLHEESIKLKSDDSRPSDVKDDLKSSDTSSVNHHCKTLILAHSKCFTLSLFGALHVGLYVHSSDVQAAMDQCDEDPYDVDITDYIMNICAHMKIFKEDIIQIQQLRQPCPCSELKKLHMLIKKKFFKMISTSFNPIPTNSEFYFYKNLTNYKSEEEIHDSDDETSVTQSDLVEFRSDKDFSIYSEGPHLLQHFESGVSNISDFLKVSDVSPLFVHLMCTLKYNNSCVASTSMRVLPTCLGELIQNLDQSLETIDKNKLQITLDILCLTLPPGVQNVITDYSNQGLRTTSFCSDGFQPSVGSFSETSFISDIPEPQRNLPDCQMKSVLSLSEEIKWLLQDEICTSLLDADPVEESTLYFVIQHVLNGNPERPSCLLERIDLNFVYASTHSHTRFLEEFTKMQLPTSFKMCKQGDFYYISKDVIKMQNGGTENNTFTNPSTSTLENTENTSEPNLSNAPTNNNTDFSFAIYDLFNDRAEQMENVNNSDGFKETDSQQSEISSTNESVLDTDGGYDEDVSEDEEDYYWLTNLDNKRPHLPNFWLIMKVDQDVVTVYFHCRFLDLPTTYVHIYMDVQRAVCEAIRELCKKVNQLLLLQSLYETKTCDPLLEPDDNWHMSKSTVSRNTSYTRLKNLDAEISDDSDIMAYSSLSEASLNFKPGYFSCPVVWETHFVLHPRLKTGPGKSGISRGILALKNILDKFSVSNRNNMFVYKDSEANVFYLRLHEDVHYNNKTMQIKPNDYDSTTVSRSPSITSLPLGQSKLNNLAQSEQSIVSVISNDLIRPRVRSFGEKEIKDTPLEDTLTLRVHGITDAGPDVQCDLVQVLQNRLDDAVLEFLSVMLARNAMCPLTPEDVHFIQKPFKQPEFIIQLSIQAFALQWLQAFAHYLKQNLLQFLNMPKYTDPRTLSHFKDYSESEESNKLAGDDHIFIYNQGQNPSSGNRGIACIALVIISNPDRIQKIDIEETFSDVFKNKDFENSVASEIIDDKDFLPNSYLEFRIWKQGRVNIENLTKKLKTAVCQANWDIVTEYFLLKKQLCVDNYDDGVLAPKDLIEIDKIDDDLSKEIEFNCILDINVDKNVKESVSNTSKKKVDAHFFPRKYNRIQPSAKATRAITFDCEDGILCEIYSKYLPSWFDFGYMYLSTPSIKPQKINLTNRHLPHIVVKELVTMLTDDTPKSFRAIPTHCIANKSEDVYVPFVSSSLIQKYVIISRNTQYNSHIDGSMYLSDIAAASNLKHTQKFIPAIYNNVYVPRQKMFWLSVENDSILIYTYNWAKDNIDKLITNCSNLGQWLCVRSCFLNSVISQKLGLFHNQPLTRKCFMIATNNYSSLIGNLECMSSFPKDHLHKRTNQPTFNLLAVLEAFRDSFRNTRYTSNDPVVIFTIEIKEMKSLEKKFREEMKKLHSMYQSRTSTTTVPQINLLMQNSRILHYCHTPLLFLPRWRLKSAATRDHSLYPSQAIQIADKLLSDEEEEWHTNLCYDFLTEYRYYLQTLGFIPLTIDSPHTTIGIWEKDKSSYNSVFYIQKTILGGILIFTVEFSEPFFVTKLHAIECNRLQIISSRASVNRFTLSFLDECDRVKIMMHLHSFTYDFHLRTIFNYVSDTHLANKLCEKYNVHQFLDDFLKYYTKAPNFARNLVHTDTITITNLVTEGRQLFDYLLSNVSQYNFRVLEMDAYDGEKEFILVRVTTTSHISYKDSQDRHHTDDFDITLIIYNLCAPYCPVDNVLHLKYYLILTSKEQHPKTEIEQKLGKFRMVSQGNKTLSRRVSEEFNASTSKTEQLQRLDLQNSDEYGSSSSFSKSGDHSNHSSQTTSLPHIEINIESVNYLGYYSSHEQVMQQIILDKAHTTQKSIREMVAKGMVHCRTNLLWNRLITPQDSNNLTYEEFIELKNLAVLKHLCQLHPDIGSLLNQPLNWYQGLAKQLLTKYADQNRTFFSPDGNVQYYVILHPRYFGAFMMLSIDLHTSRGELYAVYREPHKQEDEELCLAYQKSLLDGFVNCICFYLWSGMIST